MSRARANKFGGPWTHIKLAALKRYIDAYCKALSKRKYRVLYIDAFAGSGTCHTKDGIMDGSARIALTKDRFDEFIFIEMNPEFIAQLYDLKKEFPNKTIHILEGDCNKLLPEILRKYNWLKTRGLLFLDPYKGELSFRTLNAVTETEALDVWYLFPLHFVNRLVDKRRLLKGSTRRILTELIGTEEWEYNFYKEKEQISMWEQEEYERLPLKNMCCYIRSRLDIQFKGGVSCPIYLKNSNNAPLFLLFYAMANPNLTAKKIGHSIAEHIIDKQDDFICSERKYSAI